MAYQIVTGDILKVRIICTCQNQTSYNIRHWKCTSHVGLGASDTLFMTALNGNVPTAYKNLLANQATFWGLGVQRIRPLPESVETLDNSGTVPGVAGGFVQPKQVAGFFNLKTSLSGRKQIGRVYVPFPATDDEDPALPIPSTGYMVRLGTLAAILSGNYNIGGGGNTSTLEACVYHRDTGTADLVQTATAKQKWATQRRRGDFGRPNPPPF